MRALTGEKIFTSAFAAFALYVIWQSFEYGVFSDSITGPGFFPALAGLLIFISTAAALFSKRDEAETINTILSDNDGETGSPRGKLEYIRVATLVGLTALFIFAAPYLGMIAVTPFYIMGCFVTLAPDRSARSISIGVATAIGFTLVAWVVFDKALGVPMPHGLF